MRVVRRLVEIDPVLTPRCIIQSLLAIVETRDDSFVRIALDTLALLAVQNIKGVAQVGSPPLVRAHNNTRTTHARHTHDTRMSYARHCLHSPEKRCDTILRG
jgi:hypothetical protein